MLEPAVVDHSSIDESQRPAYLDSVTRMTAAEEEEARPATLGATTLGELCLKQTELDKS
jgi:hypothetical protein